MNFRNATTSSLVIVFAIITIASISEIRGECPPVFTFHGEGPYQWFGHAVADAGDIDGDGLSDILIGAQFYRVDSTSPDIGRVYIFSGLDGSLIRTIDGESGEFGHALTGIGDINNDGRDDIAVCAPGNYRVYVFSGLTGDTIYTLNGDSTIYGFGRSIDAEGDADGDGYSDILVGSGGIFDIGKAYVYSGRTGELIYEKAGQMAGDLFGSSVSWVGDVNMDGSDDFGVGAWRHNANGFESGRLYVYSGKTGDILYTFDGEENSQVGRGKFAGGDLDGDSHADIVFSSEIPEPGIIRAHSGVDGSLLYSLKDSSPYDEIFGGAVELVYNLARDNKYILLTFGFDGVVIGGLGVERVYAHHAETGKLFFAMEDVPMGGGNFGAVFEGLEAVTPVGYPGVVVGDYFDTTNGTRSGAAYVFANCCCDRAGDANNDGNVVISDAVFLVNYIFSNGDSPGCLDEGDANGSNSIDINDVVHIVLMIFGGPSPVICGTLGY